LPWKKSSKIDLTLNEARKVLDEDHFGLEDVKRAHPEFLAVRKLRPDSKSPILCFVGAPGVAKHRWAGRSRGREPQSSASVSAAFATKPSCAATGVPM